MSTATKQRGISFSAPMVRAIAAGKKTRTRRVMKPQPEHVNANTDLPAWDWHPPHAKFSQQVGLWIPGSHWVAGKNPEDTGAAGVIDFAPHRIGEVLYVKEALENIGGWVAYAADSQCALDEDADCVPWKWKRNRLPGIYMPKRFARYFIEITSIRVERLQEISDEDAKAEGCEGWFAAACCAGGEIQGPDGQTPAEEFRDLWVDINGRDSWDANPWVWVYEFRKVSK